MKYVRPSIIKTLEQKILPGYRFLEKQYEWLNIDGPAKSL